MEYIFNSKFDLFSKRTEFCVFWNVFNNEQLYSLKPCMDFNKLSFVQTTADVKTSLFTYLTTHLTLFHTFADHTSRIAQTSSVSSFVLFPRGKPQAEFLLQPLTKRTFSNLSERSIAPMTGTVCLKS